MPRIDNATGQPRMGQGPGGVSSSSCYSVFKKVMSELNLVDSVGVGQL